MKNYPKIVQEIHGEFESASDNLLKEVRRIIDSAPSAEKAERLKKVGFVNVPEVKKLDEIRITSELASLVEYYQREYPNNKFITEAQVMAICAKYKLVCAPLESYTGFVPEVKLSMVEKFFLKTQDVRPRMMRITKSWSSGSMLNKSKHAESVRKKLGEWIPVDHPDIYYNGGSPFSIKSGSNYMGGGYIEQVEYKDELSMLICAPEKDMKLTGLTKIGSFFTRVTKVDVPDPVVLKPCKGGFLIVCAWGDEASDEIVVNHTHN